MLSFSLPRLQLAALLSLVALSLSDAVADRVVLVAGGDKAAVDIPATEARLKEPFGVDFDRSGNLWIVEMTPGNRVLEVNPAGVLSRIAGEPTPGLSIDPGPAADAQFNGPHTLAVLPDGNVLIGDTLNKKIRKLDVKSGMITGLPGLEDAANKAHGISPYSIALDSTGARIYVADLRRVWLIDLKTGVASVVAGNGQKGVPADGAAAADAPLLDPRAVASDHQGNVYIVERDGNALRVVDKEGRIRTVVNASGKKGANGDGGPALAATLNGPKQLCVDRDDNVIIADTENHLIRRYQPTDGKIYRVAGTGVKGDSGINGDPVAVQLARPHGVAVHPATGEVYITDSENCRILKLVKE